MASLGHNELTHWPCEMVVISKVQFSNSLYRLEIWALTMKLLKLNATGLTNENLMLVEVMAWCCQTTNYYFSQYWHRSVSPYGVTRLRWGKYIWNKQNTFVISYMDLTVCCLGTISKQEVSAPISCWVTFDPAGSPILPRQKMCTYASEYNP